MSPIQIATLALLFVAVFGAVLLVLSQLSRNPVQQRLAEQAARARPVERPHDALGGHEDTFYHTMWQELETTGFWRGELWSLRKTGELYLEWLTVSAVRDTHGTTTHYVC
eukprot:gene2100-2460_t